MINAFKKITLLFQFYGQIIIFLQIIPENRNKDYLQCEMLNDIKQY